MKIRKKKPVAHSHAVNTDKAKKGHLEKTTFKFSGLCLNLPPLRKTNKQTNKQAGYNIVGYIENPGQVIVAPVVGGEPGNPSFYHRRERNEKVG